MGDFIHYAKPTPSRARRVLRLALVSLAALIALAVAFSHRNEARWWAETYSRQQRQLHFRLPPGIVVFNNNPAGPSPMFTGVTNSIPPLLNGYRPSVNNLSLLFIHDRRTSAGQRVIVALALDTSTQFHPYSRPTLAAHATPVFPLTQLHRAYWDDISESADLASLLGLSELPPDTQVFAGQPDPTDPAAFIIPMTFAGASATLRGRVSTDTFPNPGITFDPFTRPPTIPDRYVLRGPPTTAPSPWWSQCDDGDGFLTNPPTDDN